MERQDRVEAGAKVISEHFGNDDWMDRIDPQDLEMGDPCRCVLGQTFGTYSKGCDRLQPPEMVEYQERVEWAEARGFLACSEDGRELDESSRSYRSLTQAWVDYLNLRR